MKKKRGRAPGSLFGHLSPESEALMLAQRARALKGAQCKWEYVHGQLVRVTVLAPIAPVPSKPRARPATETGTGRVARRTVT